MTHKERMCAALRREPIVGRVPHFELVFFLTMEAFGKVHPSHRVFNQWDQMSAKEQNAQIRDIAACYIQTARHYEHDCIFIQEESGRLDWTTRVLKEIRDQSGDEFFLAMHGDPTFAIPDGDNMLAFTEALYEEPEALLEKAEKRMHRSISNAEHYVKQGGLLDGIIMCADYCFNVNPFMSPSMFSEFVTPYLEKTIQAYHDMGLFAIKHTDGNIMPIVDQIIQCKPDALHSLDPQAGVSLAEMKKRYGDQVCLIGNVNCGLLQTGTEEECIADIERSLREGMADGKGYIFSTSNCIYTGLALERYELMQKIWKEKGNYPAV